MRYKEKSQFKYVLNNSRESRKVRIRKVKDII